MLTHIISGGQTGADQAGLEIAHRFRIPTGGWAPKGYITKDGPNIDLKERFNLKEHRGGYKERTYENVRVSDGTIRCAVDFFTGGELCTLNAIREHNKPYFDAYLLNPASPEEFVIWILRHQIKVLNVAGNSQHTRSLDTHTLTYNYLYRAINNLIERAR